MKLSTRFIFMYVCASKKQSYKHLLDENERRRRDRRIPRASLRSYLYSSFRHLYCSGNDQALLNATGHDHASFRRLLVLFKPVYDAYMWDSELQVRKFKKWRGTDSFFGLVPLEVTFGHYQFFVTFRHILGTLCPKYRKVWVYPKFG